MPWQLPRRDNHPRERGEELVRLLADSYLFSDYDLFLVTIQHSNASAPMAAGFLNQRAFGSALFFSARRFMISGIRDHTGKNQENAEKGTYSEPMAS